jgi:hypothetical protein
MQTVSRHRNAIAAHAEQSGFVRGKGLLAPVIRAQLARVLASPLFHRSIRYQAFLRYVVEAVLSDPLERLKEQTIGVEVFGRSPGYDTNQNHVVRSTAVEIRKRLKQYYGDPRHSGEIVIDLPVGSYAPHFYPFDLLKSASLCPDGPGKRVQPAGTGFWDTVWQDSDSVIVCVSPIDISGRVEMGLTAETIFEMHCGDRYRVLLADAVAMSRVASFASSRGKQTQMRGSEELTFADFQRQPVVLIGALNNKWACTLTKSLRFTFHIETVPAIGFIQDIESPDERLGLVRFWDRVKDFEEDFAVVSRLLDPRIGKPVVTIGGTTTLGTTAAANFITDAEHLAMLEKEAPHGWNEMNLQLLLSTRIVDGSAGPPRLVATSFWRGQHKQG